MHIDTTRLSKIRIYFQFGLSCYTKKHQLNSVGFERAILIRETVNSLLTLCVPKSGGDKTKKSAEIESGYENKGVDVEMTDIKRRPVDGVEDDDDAKKKFSSDDKDKEEKHDHDHHDGDRRTKGERERPDEPANEPVS